MSATDPATPRSSARTVAIVTVIVALLAGIAIGVVADRVWLWKHRQFAVDRAFRAMTPRILARLDSELSLTPDQHHKISQILERHRTRISGITAATRPQIHHEIEQANAEIENTLSAEQRVRFQKMRFRIGSSSRGRDH